MFNDTLL